MRLRLIPLALGLLAASVPADAQQAGKVYRIGYLSTEAVTVFLPMLDAFRQGLRDLGWVEGENIILEYRLAEENHGRLADFAAELVRLKVDVIVAQEASAALATKNATTIPIVMVWVADPVGSGLVASLARPGGNVTGLTNILPALSGKQLEFLKEVVPSISRVAVLWDPTHPGSQLVFKQTQAAAQMLGVTLQSVKVANLKLTALQEPAPGELESAFSVMTRERADALLMVLSGVMFRPAYQVAIADLALKHRLPMASNSPWLTEHGGLMSYLPSIGAMYRRAAVFVDKILKGAKPADLPVEQPTKFDLVINLKTATALGLTLPDSLLFQADKVIR